MVVNQPARNCLVMNHYISLLHGINVGGQRRIRMEELRALYESLNFNNVRTYIQSGNVIFDSHKSSISGLTNTIETAIEQTFGFSVTTLIRKKKEFYNLIESNPFLDECNGDITKLHVTFLSDTPSSSSVIEIKEVDYGSDQLFISGKEIHLYCPNGYGRTKLSNSFFERKLGMSATTRNWKTVTTLFDLSD